MASGMGLEFDTRHHAVVNLLVLGTMLVLPIARVRLLRLHKQDTTIVFPRHACYLEHLRLDLYSNDSCAKIIYNFVTSNLVTTCHRLYKLVLNGDCVVRKHEAAKL